MNSPGWFRAPMARMVMAAGIGLAGGFGTLVVANAATSPAPSVSPDVGASRSTNASPSTTDSRSERGNEPAATWHLISPEGQSVTDWSQ